MTALWIVLGIVVLLLLIGVAMYNRFVSQRQSIRDAFSNIDTELKRRYDLIPNLVETVRGYASHEKETFDAVTQARTAAQAAQGPAAQGQAEGVLTAALGRLFAVAEAYPQLRATENFQALQGELSGTENRIQVVRETYNENVRVYNERVQSVPSNIIAGMFNFELEEFFEIGDAERAAAEKAPDVNFSSQPPAATPPPSAPTQPSGS
ncbi:MAG: LemA family protein [Actinomycetota bacterium]